MACGNENQYYQEIGSNIRMFRRMRQMTQRELAQQISKSLACISKYEKGDISIDVFTLSAIAHTLGVPIYSFLPENAGQGDGAFAADDLPVFLRKEVLYLYMYLGDKRKLTASALTVDLHTGKAILYVQLEGTAPDNFKKCRQIMTGTVSLSDFILRVTLENPLIRGDYTIFSFPIASIYQEKIIGSSFGLSTSLRCFSAKCLLSPVPINDQNDILPHLMITKEELSYIRKNHQFLV